MKLQHWLAERYEITYPKLQSALRKKQIKINGTKASADSEVTEKDTVQIFTKFEIKKKKLFSSRNIKNYIVDENANFVIINKPYGVQMQGCLNSIAQLTDGYIVHRLDNTTTGLAVIAKNKDASSILSKIFQEKGIFKQYIAICEQTDQSEGIEDAGKFETLIDGKSSLTYYEILERNRNELVVLFHPITGRKHQIRISCFENGIPIVGDMKYGGIDADRIYLHCCRLKFTFNEVEYDYESDPGF